MNILVTALTKLDDMLAKGEEWALVALVTVMSVVVFLQVLYRYFLSQPLYWSEELARYVFVWIALLGAALSVRKKGHFGMDYLHMKLPAAARGWITGFIYCAMGIVILVLLANGILLVQKTVDQESPAMQISMGWAYACLPIGAALMLIHLLCIIARGLAGKSEAS